MNLESIVPAGLAYFFDRFPRHSTSFRAGLLTIAPPALPAYAIVAGSAQDTEPGAKGGERHLGEERPMRRRTFSSIPFSVWL